jgi:pimeloyl-ACP methyl ester carboxylesterase
LHFPTDLFPKGSSMSRFRRGWLCGSLSFDRCVLAIATFGLMFGLVAIGSRADAADDPVEKKIPAPEDIELETSDGLQMQATFYGSNQGKNAVPVIMLHAWKGSRADFAGLALDLQARGCAVIVPDLRGHGKSTTIKRGTDTLTIEQPTMRRGDIEAIVTQDLEAVKTFLMERNNAGELNIEKLCVVGNEMGAMLAVNWAVYDWHWAQLPTVKQGQDVKALVLISPPMNFQGINIASSLNQPLLQTGLSVLIIAGKKNSKAMEDAKHVNSSLIKLRGKPPTDPKEAADRQDLFFDAIDGISLQGANILNDNTILAHLDAVVGQFIELRLVNKKFPWTNRKGALEK